MLLALALVLALGESSIPWAEACPQCKNALASSAGGRGDWVGGFFWSILFMLSMPFVLTGSFGAYCYFLVQRAKRETAAARTSPALQDVSSSLAAGEIVESDEPLALSSR